MMVTNIIRYKAMRKILSILAIAVLVVFNSCDKNEKPEFSDSNAFVSFDKAALSVTEDGATLSIPVTLASVKGVSATVSYTVINGTAVEGTNFTLADGSATLTFDAANRTQNIVVNIINKPGVYTGDLRFKLQLSADGKVKPNAENICEITISDRDHPLAAILGEWSATGTSYYNGSETWEMEFSKDPSDVSIVWIDNFVTGGSSLKVYGVVNAAKTEIKIPVYQRIAESSSYGYIALRGYYGPDGATAIPVGGSITINIEANRLVVLDEIGSYVYQNADMTGGLGWFNIFAADVVLTRPTK
ncbi:MAG: hypothetical protein F9K37_04795 [Bacteroidales bacterium]|nr:MAG: hypothetical protein F9K37_04795 [Bacteroidales bacterium]